MIIPHFMPSNKCLSLLQPITLDVFRMFNPQDHEGGGSKMTPIFRFHCLFWDISWNGILYENSSILEEFQTLQMFFNGYYNKKRPLYFWIYKDTKHDQILFLEQRYMIKYWLYTQKSVKNQIIIFR